MRAHPACGFLSSVYGGSFFFFFCSFFLLLFSSGVAPPHQMRCDERAGLCQPSSHAGWTKDSISAGSLPRREQVGEQVARTSDVDSFAADYQRSYRVSDAPHLGVVAGRIDSVKTSSAVQPFITQKALFLPAALLSCPPPTPLHQPATPLTGLRGISKDFIFYDWMEVSRFGPVVRRYTRKRTTSTQFPTPMIGWRWAGLAQR